MTSPASNLAVTGSTGRLGSRVARRLAAAGVHQRLVVRDANRAPHYDDVEIVEAAYGDREASVRALQGVATLFMVSAAEHPERVAQHTAFIDAAAEVGVSRIVYTSFYAAGPDAAFTLARDHWATEEHIRSSGLRYTILRDNLYLDFIQLLADNEGVIRGPAGDGRVSAVATDDVADVAAAVLRHPEDHDNQVYDLTGPQAITMEEAAAILTRAAGHTYSYLPETIDEAYASRAHYGAPDWQVEGWVTTYVAIAKGELDGVTDTVERIADHPATSLEELLSW